MKKRIIAFTITVFVLLLCRKALAATVITSTQIENAIQWANNYWDAHIKGNPGDVYANPENPLCAAFAVDAYRNGAGMYNVSYYPSAKEMGDALITSTSTDVPRGAFVFWNVPHVAISLGNGQCIDSGNTVNKTHSISGLTKYYGAGSYRGWGWPIKGAGSEVAALKAYHPRGDGGIYATGDTVSLSLSNATSSTAILYVYRTPLEGGDAQLYWEGEVNPSLYEMTFPYTGHYSCYYKGLFSNSYHLWYI